jgi:nicotinamide-nucleotide amidase
MEKIRAYFALRGQEPPKGVWKMARVPRGARVFMNEIGMACGFAAKLDKSVIISMPGVPREMKRMFDKGVLPFLREELGVKDRTALLFRTALIREGEVDEKIKSSGLPLGEMEWGICSGSGVNDISFSELPGKPFDAPAIGRAMKEIFAESLLDGASLEEDVVRLLAERGMTIALAESCTGGMIAVRITDVPGASKVFPGSVVAYSNEAKVKLLGVSASTLERYGAVSEETAIEMADGARNAFRADIGVSVTGIAGPAGGSAEKPAGTVCFGFAWPGKTVSKREFFPGDRERVRLFSTAYALNRVRMRLLCGI